MRPFAIRRLPTLLSVVLGLSACAPVTGGDASTEQAISDDVADATKSVSTEAPAIDWASIGQKAPTPIATGSRAADDPLPKADIVILTWTFAEWSALDHVFLSSTSARGSASNDSWQNAWSSYTRNASGFSDGGSGGTLWGSFKLVQITDTAGKDWRVLLFKSNAHLAHEPWIAGLRAMVQNILADTTPQRIYSIGTAGAALTNQQLGDAVITNAAFLQATLPDNDKDTANGKTFSSSSFPVTTLEASAQAIMFPLSKAATSSDLASLFKSAVGNFSSVKSTDLIDSALTDLTSPTVHALPDVPLNTSDDYGLAPGNGVDPYSVYEEDDAVVAAVASNANVAYASIRNVSDTVVPSTTATGKTISDSVRQSWASAVYARYGLLTAVNGAIAAWATVAGN